jgi:hypothetical protein
MSNHLVLSLKLVLTSLVFPERNKFMLTQNLTIFSLKRLFKILFRNVLQHVQNLFSTIQGQVLR